MSEPSTQGGPNDQRGRFADARFALHLLRRNPLIVAGIIISAASLFVSAFADYLVSPAAGRIVESNLNLNFCWNNPLINWHIENLKVCAGPVYPLGTDAFGRNVLDVIVLAVPLDMKIALEVVLSAVVIGVVLGAVAGYAGGIIDEIILRVTDVFLALPAILLAIVIIAATPIEYHSFTLLTEAILVTWWPTYVRLIRSQVLGEKEKPYVEALRAVGAGRVRVLFRHVIPNSIYPIFVQATLDIGSVILTITALTFLGITPNPDAPELGNLANQGIQYLFTAPWLIIFPGVTILIISLGFNLLGDGIRDIFDPRLRR